MSFKDTSASLKSWKAWRMKRGRIQISEGGRTQGAREGARRKDLWVENMIRGGKGDWGRWVGVDGGRTLLQWVPGSGARRFVCLGHVLPSTPAPCSLWPSTSGNSPSKGNFRVSRERQWSCEQVLRARFIPIPTERGPVQVILEVLRPAVSTPLLQGWVLSVLIGVEGVTVQQLNFWRRFKGVGTAKTWLVPIKPTLTLHARLKIVLIRTRTGPKLGTLFRRQRFDLSPDSFARTSSTFQ